MKTAKSCSSEFLSLARPRFLFWGVFLGAIAFATLGFWAAGVRAEGNRAFSRDRGEILVRDEGRSLEAETRKRIEELEEQHQQVRSQITFACQRASEIRNQIFEAQNRIALLESLEPLADLGAIAEIQVSQQENQVISTQTNMLSAQDNIVDIVGCRESTLAIEDERFEHEDARFDREDEILAFAPDRLATEEERLVAALESLFAEGAISALQLDLEKQRIADRQNDLHGTNRASGCLERIREIQHLLEVEIEQLKRLELLANEGAIAEVQVARQQQRIIFLQNNLANDRDSVLCRENSRASQNEQLAREENPTGVGMPLAVATGVSMALEAPFAIQNERAKREGEILAMQARLADAEEELQMWQAELDRLLAKEQRIQNAIDRLRERTKKISSGCDLMVGLPNGTIDMRCGDRDKSPTAPDDRDSRLYPQKPSKTYRNLKCNEKRGASDRFSPLVSPHFL